MNLENKIQEAEKLGNEADEMLDRLNKILQDFAEKTESARDETIRELFTKFTAHGFNVGAKMVYENPANKTPVDITIVGIYNGGFIAEFIGKDGTPTRSDIHMTHRYKHLELFKIKEVNK